MQCQACQTSILGKIIKLKVIHGVQIYACPECGLGFVTANTPRRPTHKVYSFSDYDIRRTQFEKRYKRLISKINNLFKDKPNHKQVRVLEVGAGFGLLSKMVDEEGYFVTALEPHLKPDYLQNTAVKLVQAPLSEYAAHTSHTFDCIILFDVIEHVDNLNVTLQEIRKLLTQSGILIVQTPNYNSLMQYLSKEWSWWMVEDHRFYFTKESLLNLFIRHRFSVVSYTSYEDWEDYLNNISGWTAHITHPLFRKIAKFGIYLSGGLCKILFQPFYALGYGGLHLIFIQKNK